MLLAKELRRAARRVMFVVLDGLARLGRMGGPARLAQFGRGVGAFHYAVSFRRRRRLTKHVARALGLDSAREAAEILRSSYRSGDRAVLEVIAMCGEAVPDAWIDASLRVEGLARLRTAVDDGKGVVLIGMHMGNGILLSAWLARHGIPVSLVHRQSQKMPHGALARCIELHGVEGICARQRERAYREMLQALRRGRVLFVLMDQDSKHGGVPVRMLGKDVEIAAGPPALALRTGAPLMTAFATDDSPGWSFRIGLPLDCGDSLEQAGAAIAQAMDSHIRAHPHMWTWHHRRWRNYPFPPESARDTHHSPTPISINGGIRATADAGSPMARPEKENSSTSSW